MKLIKKVYRKIFKRKTVFKQELLLRLALEEKNINPKNLEIKCDHILGINYVNGIELSIKYPDSFYFKAIKLIPKVKENNYYFNGNTSESGKREEMLLPFVNLKRSEIISSNDGRVQKNKDKFNIEYFKPFAQAKFGLCPHQADWQGNKDSMWTYRFIESCFVEAIPIVFIDAPLGKKFTKDIFYYTDKEILNKEIFSDLNNPVYDNNIAKRNRKLAKEYFCLSDNECESIKKTFQEKDENLTLYKTKKR